MVLGFLRKKEDEKNEDSTAIPDFNSIPETPVEIVGTIIEPGGSELYKKRTIQTPIAIVKFEDDDGNIREEVQYQEEVKDQQKLFRDLPLGNFNSIDEEIIGNCLLVAEHCDDIDFPDAGSFYTRITYQKANISRGRMGFLQKQIGTKALEIKKTDIKEQKKKQGLLG